MRSLLPPTGTSSLRVDTCNQDSVAALNSTPQTYKPDAASSLHTSTFAVSAGPIPPPNPPLSAGPASLAISGKLALPIVQRAPLLAAQFAFQAMCLLHAAVTSQWHLACAKKMPDHCWATVGPFLVLKTQWQHRVAMLPLLTRAAILICAGRSRPTRLGTRYAAHAGGRGSRSWQGRGRGWQGGSGCASGEEGR